MTPETDSKNIHCRDCFTENIMMDARGMYPSLWHPQMFTLRPDGQPLHSNLTRTQAGGVRYYFIDFGISSWKETKVLGQSGLIRAPELSSEVPYNPFKLDVYILGKMFALLFKPVCSPKRCLPVSICPPGTDMLWTAASNECGVHSSPDRPNVCSQSQDSAYRPTGSRVVRNDKR